MEPMCVLFYATDQFHNFHNLYQRSISAVYTHRHCFILQGSTTAKLWQSAILAENYSSVRTVEGFKPGTKSLGWKPTQVVGASGH